MVKNFLKIAGVKTKAEFYKKYPTEAAFFRAHPEARELAEAARGGAFIPTYGDMVLPKAMYGLGMAQGGKMPQWLAERRFGAAGKEHLMDSYGYQEGGMAPEQGGGGQEEQIVQFIVQALQQGMPPEKIVEALVQQGIPQEQAVQLIQAVMQQMQQQQGAAEEQGEPMQEAPPQEMAEGQAPPMGMYGGSYKHGGQSCPDGMYWDETSKKCLPYPSFSAIKNYKPGMQILPSMQKVDSFSNYFNGLPNVSKSPMSSEVMMNPSHISLDNSFRPFLNDKEKEEYLKKLNVPKFSDNNTGMHLYRHGGMHGNPGTYADGYSGTYSNGVYFNYGGTPYLPDYSMAYGGSYQAGGQTDQLVQQVAQLLQQGVQPEMIVEQLVKAKIPKKQATQLVAQVAQQMQQSMGQQQMGMGQQPMAAYGGPYMPLSNRMNSSNFAYGGSTQYKKGGEYEMSENEIQDLINKGYKIQYL